MQLSATLPAQLRRLGRAVVDGVLPPRCLACGAIVDEPDTLCGACWAGITFSRRPGARSAGMSSPYYSTTRKIAVRPSRPSLDVGQTGEARGARDSADSW